MPPSSDDHLYAQVRASTTFVAKSGFVQYRWYWHGFCWPLRGQQNPRQYHLYCTQPDFAIKVVLARICAIQVVI